MTVRKVILFTLLPFALLAVFILWMLLHAHSGLSEIIGFFFIPFLVWAVGLLPGLFLSVIVKRPKLEPYFYLGSELLLVFFILSFYIPDIYSNYIYDRKYGNIDHNRSLVKDEKDDTGTVKTAFAKLEAEFTDPNSFLIVTFATFSLDTLIDDHAKMVYFTYTVNKKIFFSRVTIVNHQAAISFLNRDIRFADKYEQDALKTHTEIKRLMDSAELLIDQEDRRNPEH